jgi:hypothetical protein
MAFVRRPAGTLARTPAAVAGQSRAAFRSKCDADGVVVAQSQSRRKANVKLLRPQGLFRRLVHGTNQQAMLAWPASTDVRMVGTAPDTRLRVKFAQ